MLFGRDSRVFERSAMRRRKRHLQISVSGLQNPRAEHLAIDARRPLSTTGGMEYASPPAYSTPLLPVSSESRVRPSLRVIIRMMSLIIQ